MTDTDNHLNKIFKWYIAAHDDWHQEAHLINLTWDAYRIAYPDHGQNVDHVKWFAIRKSLWEA